MDDDILDQTYSVPTADLFSKSTKRSYSDRDEEQILVINRSRNLSLSPRPQQRYVHPYDIPHADGISMANRPGQRTGTKLVLHHSYAP